MPWTPCSTEEKTCYSTEPYAGLYSKIEEIDFDFNKDKLYGSLINYFSYISKIKTKEDVTFRNVHFDKLQINRQFIGTYAQFHALIVRVPLDVYVENTKNDRQEGYQDELTLTYKFNQLTNEFECCETEFLSESKVYSEFENEDVEQTCSVNMSYLPATAHDSLKDPKRMDQAKISSKVKVIR